MGLVMPSSTPAPEGFEENAKIREERKNILDEMGIDQSTGYNTYVNGKMFSAGVLAKMPFLDPNDNSTIDDFKDTVRAHIVGNIAIHAVGHLFTEDGDFGYKIVGKYFAENYPDIDEASFSDFLAENNIDGSYSDLYNIISTNDMFATYEYDNATGLSFSERKKISDNLNPEKNEIFDNTKQGLSSLKNDVENKKLSNFEDFLDENGFTQAKPTSEYDFKYISSDKKIVLEFDQNNLEIITTTLIQQNQQIKGLLSYDIVMREYSKNNLGA